MAIVERDGKKYEQYQDANHMTWERPYNPYAPSPGAMFHPVDPLAYVMAYAAADGKKDGK